MENNLLCDEREFHIPLEEMRYLLIGRNNYDLSSIISRSEELGIPLAFFNENTLDRQRLLIGRDYGRMEPVGTTDYRVEIHELLLEQETGIDFIGSVTFSEISHSDHPIVTTSPAFTLWETNLTLPFRERFVASSANPHSSLNVLVNSFILDQGQNVSRYIIRDLQRDGYR